MEVKSLTEKQFSAACSNFDEVFKSENDRLSAFFICKAAIDDLHHEGVVDSECARLESYIYTKYICERG